MAGFKNDVLLKQWTALSELDARFLNSLRLAYVFGHMGEVQKKSDINAILITEEDEVFGVGSNGGGCLGLGSVEGAQRVTKIEGLCGKGVEGIVQVRDQMMALSSDGQLYIWGFVERGHITLSPKLVAGDLAEKHVIQIVCGKQHRLALTDEGEVFSWGFNDCGQLGARISEEPSSFGGCKKVQFNPKVHVFGSALEENLADQFEELNTASQLSWCDEGWQEPRKVTEVVGGRRAVAIACNLFTSFALLEDGQLYGWGSGYTLGIGTKVNHPVPVQVPVSNKEKNIIIKQICCGEWHSLALSDNGEIFAWGANLSSQLATGCNTFQPSPVRIAKDFGRAVEIAACLNVKRCAAKFEDGTVCMWGRLNNGYDSWEPVQTSYTTIHEVFTPEFTYKPLALITTAQVKRLRQTVETFQTAFDTKESADVCFHVEGRKIWAHRAIIEARCKHLQLRLQSTSHDGALEICECTYQVFLAFVKYLYTEIIEDLDEWDVIGLLDLTNSYGELELKSRCLNLLRGQVSVDNVATFFDTALMYGDEELQEFCINFALGDAMTVVDSQSFKYLDVVVAAEFLSRVKDLRKKLNEVQGRRRMTQGTPVRPKKHGRDRKSV